MSDKEIVDASLRFLGILISWPVIFLCVMIVVRRELPAIISKLAERITKAPGGFEFAILQQKVEALSTKIEYLEKLTFEPSSALTPKLQADLQSSFDSFQTYLAELGYKSKTGKVVVFVDPTLKDNVYYDNMQQRIVLGEPLAQDSDAIFREYTHHALVAGVDWHELTDEKKAIESGLADYFPCSFSNDPLFGEKSIHLFRKWPGFESKPAIRHLINNRKFNEASREFHDVGEVWGGAFWELRQQLGQSTADKLLFSTWSAALYSSDIHGDFSLTFVKKLLETAQSLEGGVQNSDIREVFERRGLKL